MKVSKILEKKGGELFSIRPDATVAECVELLNEKHVGALVVLDDAGHLEGVISERDVLRKAYEAASKTIDCGKLVKDLMRPAVRLPTATVETNLKQVMKLMTGDGSGRVAR